MSAFCFFRAQTIVQTASEQMITSAPRNNSEVGVTERFLASVVQHRHHYAILDPERTGDLLIDLTSPLEPRPKTRTLASTFADSCSVARHPVKERPHGVGLIVIVGLIFWCDCRSPGSPLLCGARRGVRLQLVGLILQNIGKSRSIYDAGWSSLVARRAHNAPNANRLYRIQTT
jgi:hypothetical protein